MMRDDDEHAVQRDAFAQNHEDQRFAEALRVLGEGADSGGRAPEPTAMPAPITGDATARAAAIVPMPILLSGAAAAVSPSAAKAMLEKAHAS